MKNDKEAIKNDRQFEHLWAYSNNVEILNAGPLASALVELFGCRKVAIMGSLLSAGGLFLASFSSNILFFYITYGLLAGITEFHY